MVQYSLFGTCVLCTKAFFGQISMWNVKSPNTGAPYETGEMV